MASRSIRYKSLSIRSPRFVGVGVGDDNDAAAFLQEAGIADYMQQRAIFELVSRLKGAGLWSKMKAIYPFIGGTASTHKWNLKDPRDVDAAFRLIFNGGFTHSNNGADPNGTNAWADTKLIPNSDLTLTSSHISIYVRENVDALEFDMGAANSASDYTTLVSRFGDLQLGRIHSTANTSQSNTDSRGFYISNRTDSSNQKIYKNANSPTSSSQPSTALPTQSIGICAFNNIAGGQFYYSSRQVAFATIGDGLTDSDATNLYDIVDLYQKRLSRAV